MQALYYINAKNSGGAKEAGKYLIKKTAAEKPVIYDKKPFIKGGPHFNLSHSGDFAVIAVSETSRVGIDIENTGKKRDFDGIAKRAFCHDELIYYYENPSPRRFYEIWTKKEAFVKMTGEGLYRELKSFNVFEIQHVKTFDFLFPYIISLCAEEKIDAAIYETFIRAAQ